ncbi:methyltransferase [Micromonospora sp. C32]|uniref:methyltransferase n=1 Tax=unclassified Micromonospora TaxID=2617518 RepID=UPI001B38657B|nr:MULTISPECIES: methyltransferase [unclassified Micromonospora]MBQ1041750.1 methyltransferase [Micromonospora sp. C72]MBQ1053205.1 methyltransferase [Micromonospora sp. C32]
MAIDAPIEGDAAERLDRLTDLATPFAVRTVVTLRVPDLIADGVTALPELAGACGADAAALGRLLRYLAHRGVFVEVSPDVFALTDVGELLCDREGGGLGAYLDLGGLGARMDLAWAGLPHAIRTGGPGYREVHGRDFWADLDAHPDHRAYFDALMLSQQRFTAPEVAALYPWHEARHVVDVGGGAGGLLREVLGAHPHLRGTLVDRAEPVATAAATFAECGLAGRAETVIGDFFAPLPPGADVYVVSRALTDWSDAHAAAILRRCAEAAGAAGRVLVIEVLPTVPHVPHLSPYDLRMLVLVGGRERGVPEYAGLAAAAGLSPRRTYHGADGLTLMEFAAGA